MGDGDEAPFSHILTLNFLSLFVFFFFFFCYHGFFLMMWHFMMRHFTSVGILLGIT
jgi:hypothetical protein